MQIKELPKHKITIKLGLDQIKRESLQIYIYIYIYIYSILSINKVKLIKFIIL